MDKKNFFQKLKIGFFGISIIGSLFFSCSQKTPKALEKYNTLAHKILMIEDSADNIPFNTCPAIKTLDSLINNSKEYLEKKEFYSKEDLEKISNKIYSEISKLPELENREDQCYRNSLIYLAIGEANEILFYLVDIPGHPGHTFIRYKDSVNIETINGEIQKNEKYSNKYYINEFAITKNSLEKEITLKNLSEKEARALAYSETAADCLKGKGNSQKEFFRKKAIEYCNKALELSPNFKSAYIALGIAESAKEEFPVSYGGNKKAIKCFEKALEINPSANTYYLIANSYRELSQRKKAIDNYTNSLNLIYESRKEFNKSGNYLKDLEVKCLLWRARMYEILGDDNKSERDKKKVSEIAKGN